MDETATTLLTPLQNGALWLQIAFYSVTAVSILIAGGVGIFKYRLFRSGRPFVTVSLDANSRLCSESHIQVGNGAALQRLQGAGESRRSGNRAKRNRPRNRDFHIAVGLLRRADTAVYPSGNERRIRLDCNGISRHGNRSGG